jgi:hypothetical protein
MDRKNIGILNAMDVEGWRESFTPNLPIYFEGIETLTTMVVIQLEWNEYYEILKIKIIFNI